MPRSSTAKFSDRWQRSVGDEGFLDQVVERWRSSGAIGDDDNNASVAMMADAVLGASRADEHAEAEPPRRAIARDTQPSHAPMHMPEAAAPRSYDAPAQRAYPATVRHEEPAPLRSSRSPEPSPARQPDSGMPAGGNAGQGRQGSLLRRDPAGRQASQPAQQRYAEPAHAAPADGGDAGSQSLRSLRDRLMQRTR
ncbi:MAG: hypothetical protein AB7E80_15010 [Hyphomicrobiaceae bacterium]